MFLNILFRPIIAYVLLAVIAGILLSKSVAFFLPYEILSYKIDQKEEKETHFKVNKAFSLIAKKEKVVVKKTTKHQPREYLLKAFGISGIIFTKDDDTNNLVIVRSSKGGTFVYVKEYYKEYQLLNVFPMKARFKKGDDFYWAFLSPKDEKSFLEKSASSVSSASSSKSKKPEFITLARSMSSSIKYKNGKYFIPEELLQNKKDIFKMLSSINIVNYNINGKISFMVKYVHPSSIFTKLGIRQHDQICKINGEDVKSFNQPLELFKNLNTIKQLSITVRRSGKNKELIYEVY